MEALKQAQNTSKVLIEKLLDEIQQSRFLTGDKPKSALREFATSFLDSEQPPITEEECLILLKGDLKSIGLIQRCGFTRISGDLRWSSVMCLELLSKLLNPNTNISASKFHSALTKIEPKLFNSMKLEAHISIARDKSIPFSIISVLQTKITNFDIKTFIKQQDFIESYFQYHDSHIYEETSLEEVSNEPTTWADIDIKSLLEDEEDDLEYELSAPIANPPTKNSLSSSPLQILRNKIRRASFQLGIPYDPLDISSIDSRAYRESMAKQRLWRKRSQYKHSDSITGSTLLTDPSFKSTLFLSEAHSNTSYDLLAKGLSNLQVHISSRAEQLKSFVQELFSVYVSCHENNNQLHSKLTDRETELKNLYNMTLSLKTDISTLYSHLISNSEEADRIIKVLRVIKRYQVLFSLAGAIDSHITTNQYVDITKDYKRLKSITVPSDCTFLIKVHQQLLSRFSNFRQYLLEKLAEPECPTDIVQLLIDLDCYNENNLDPALFYLTKQYESVSSAMDACISEHQHFLQFVNPNETEKPHNQQNSQPFVDEPAHLHSLENMIRSFSSIFLKKLSHFWERSQNLVNLKHIMTPSHHSAHSIHHKHKASLRGPIRFGQSVSPIHASHLNSSSSSMPTISLDEIKSMPPPANPISDFVIKICEKFCSTIRKYLLPEGFTMPSSFKYSSTFHSLSHASLLTTSVPFTVIKTINTVETLNLPHDCSTLLNSVLNDMAFFLISAFFLKTIGQIIKLPDEENWMMENGVHITTGLPKKFRSIMLRAIYFLETIPLHNSIILVSIAAAPFFSCLRIFADCLHELVFEFDSDVPISATRKSSHNCSDSCLFAVICNCHYIIDKILPEISSRFLRLVPSSLEPIFKKEFENIVLLYSAFRSFLSNHYVRVKVLFSIRRIKLAIFSEKTELMTNFASKEKPSLFIRPYVYELLLNLVLVHNETSQGPLLESDRIFHSIINHILNYWIDMISTINRSPKTPFIPFESLGIQLHSETEFFKSILKKYINGTSISTTKKMRDWINKLCIIDNDIQKVCDDAMSEARNKTKLLFACFQ